MILNVPAARVPEMQPISSISILESDKILNTGIYFILLNNRLPRSTTSWCGVR